MPAYRQSRESIFIKQGKLLASYEDDYVYDRRVTHYFPTYQSLTNPELRGYFSWRTKLRRGNLQKTSLTYAFLYIYELLNQIGVADPVDGYHKLTEFQDAYGALDDGILPYLNLWLMDYVVYYNLDAGLLADTPQVRFNRGIAVLDSIQSRGDEEVIRAVKQLSPKWLERSKFYREYREDCDTVTVRVLRRMSAHYNARCKKTMVEQYFGSFSQYRVMQPLFSDEFLKPLTVKGGVSTAVRFTADDVHGVVVPKAEPDLTAVLQLPSYIEAPVQKGRKIGSVAFYNGDTMLYETALVTTEPVEAMTFSRAFAKITVKMLKF